MNRRKFLKNIANWGIGACFYPYVGKVFAGQGREKMLVLGIDGMDPHLTQVYMQQGLLPNIKRLVACGSFSKLATSAPPQSPVAWSGISVGGRTDVHGIYDFIHRNPDTMIPYLSTSRVQSSSRMLHIGDYNIPLSSGKTENLRKGKAFWEYLADHDIPTTLFKMPANFPCESDNVEMVSGMGTPDLRGGYGSYTVFTTRPDKIDPNVSGGVIVPVAFTRNHVKTHLSGPQNTFKKDSPAASIPISIRRDTKNAVVRISIQQHEFILNQGDWTGWLQISFPMLGSLIDVKGICKIYIKQVHPEFYMYVSPINIDPSDPALPVVSSKGYGKLLTENTGFFYTQGFPEDTKALSEGIFSEDEYLELAHQVFDERRRLLEFEFQRFVKRDSGFLFFYFSSLDQNSHMYWRVMDKAHPQYTPELHAKYGDTLKRFYIQVDRFLGDIMGQVDIKDPDFSLMIISDHGFCPFRWQVNLNTWLFHKQYLASYTGKLPERDGYFGGVDWGRTYAYNLGINAIYINLFGREKNGIVMDNEAGSLREKIKKDLLELIDPATGQNVVSQVLIISDAERKLNPQAPDLIVGWNIGYRTSWKSILGGFEHQTISANLDKWSGDHCVDAALVPALFLANKKILTKGPQIYDIAPTILHAFGIRPDRNMQGKSVFG